MKDYCKCSYPKLWRGTKSSQEAYCFECNKEIDETMRDNYKPDFKAIVKEKLIARGEHPSRVDNPIYGEELEVGEYVGEKIWNDFVVPRDAKIAELEKQKNKILDEANFYYDEYCKQKLQIDRLKSELDKAKKILSDYVHYGDSRIARDQASDFLKDKK